MKDRNGKPVAVGDRVFVLPSKRRGSDGGAGFVRKITIGERGEHARIDDGPKDMGPITEDARWSWSAWCEEGEIEVV